MVRVRVGSFVWAGVAALLWSLSPAAGHAAEAPMPLAVFGRLPSLENVVISPNAHRLALVSTAGDVRALLVQDIGGEAHVKGVRVGNTKLRDVVWMDDDNLLITLSSTSPPPMELTGATREWYQLLIFNVPKSKLLPMPYDAGGRNTMNVISDTPVVRTIEGKTVLFVPGYLVSDRVLPALFKLPLGSYTSRMVSEAPQPWTDWLIDAEGNIAAEFVYDDHGKDWSIKARKDGHLRAIASGITAIDVPTLLGFDASGANIIVRFLENGEPVWKPLAVKDGTWGAPVAGGAAFGRVVEDDKTGRIIGGVREYDDTSYVFFDNEIQAHWTAALRTFPRSRVHLVSHSDDYSRLVLTVFNAEQGYVYALFDWYTHKSTILGSAYEGLTATAEVRPVTYLASDGLSIPGFLTLPRGRAEKNLPLVVLPHGGPAAVDTQDFDWWSQALAEQGYAVLQPNFRGSTLDTAMLAKGFGEWGRKMQTDLSDGVRYLAKEGIIDPRRVCIFGGSYGGYAALAGVTLESGVYRCAISLAGISDLKKMRAWTRQNESTRTQRYWDRFMGVNGDADLALRSISPIEHIDATSVPVLLIHGKDDTVVPYEQSTLMFNALKKTGKPVEMVTLKNEDHWLSSGATRLQMLQASVAFLRLNNPPD